MTSAFEPHVGDVPRISTSVALAQPGPGGRMDLAAQMALRMQTIMVDLTLDEDALYGRPRSAVGFVSRIDGPALAAWAAAHLPPWQDLDSAGWNEVARLLAAWVRARDERAAIAVPADARRAAELAVERVRAARRAELERQAAEAEAALAALDTAPAPEVEPPRRVGWMRRATPP